MSTAVTTPHVEKGRKRDTIIAVCVLVVLLVGGFFALGGLGKAAPYLGEPAEIDEEIRIPSWRIAVHSATATKDGIDVEMTLENRTDRSEFGPQNYVLLLMVPDAPNVWVDVRCKPSSAETFFQPGMPERAVCTFKPGKVGTYPDVGQLHEVKVMVLRDELVRSVEDPLGTRQGSTAVRNVRVPIKEDR